MSSHKRCGEQVSNLATPTPADNKIKLQGQTYRRDGQPVCKPGHEFVARQSETLTSHDIAAFLIISSEDYQLPKPWDSCGQHDSFAIMWSAMLLGLVDSTVVYLLYLSQPIDVVSRGFYSNRSKYLYRDADAVNVNEQQTPLDKVIQTAVPAIAIDDLEDYGREKNSTANSAKCIMRCGFFFYLYTSFDICI
uniref:Uncharacterized protein n=1 Tax=Glossina palpalis gambiensis TaxID=67801 RepID=A0A1B0B5F1_9MUSC